MSRLLVIRHGQASFLADDYDQLSPLGEEQGRALGASWSARGVVPDRVFVGPRRRHRQTAAAVASVFAAEGLRWPEEVVLAELDEHDGQEVVERALSEVLGEAELPSRSSPEGRRAYFDAFRRITRSWVLGERATPPGLESWPAFRDRVSKGLAKASAGDHRETVAVFTSGGPAAVAAGWVLALPDEKVLELSWVMRNAAAVEIARHDDGRTLHAFNAVEHLRDPRLVTYI